MWKKVVVRQGCHASEGVESKKSALPIQSPNRKIDLKVKMVVFQDGERCPMLMDGNTGIPLYNPSVWTLTTYRRESAATMEQALRGAMVLHVWCAANNVDLIDRIRTSRFLAPHELDDLEVLASKSKRELGEMTIASEAPQNTAQISPKKRPTKKKRHFKRLPLAKPSEYVDINTKRLRLFYAGKYITWLSDKQLFKIDQLEKRSIHSRMLESIIESLKTRSKGKSVSDRIALDPQQRIALHRIVDPDCLDNPWKSQFVRLRNQLIARMLIGPGMRRGELLSLTVRQVQAQLAQVEIRRNQDDKSDPRKKQPQAKTNERLLPLGDELLVLLLAYIKARGKIKGARKHRFLIVSETGRPLSLSAFTDIFRAIRDKSPHSLGPTSAHVLRHTANEIFSDEADEIGMSEETEKRVRRELFGWSPTSDMPDYYLKRKTKRQAGKMSQDVQRRVMQDAQLASIEVQKDLDESDALRQWDDSPCP